MTWDPEYDDESWDDEAAPVQAREIPIGRPPAVWPVFVTFAGAFVAILGLQIVLAIGFVIWLIVAGENIQEIAKDPIDAIAWPGVLTAFASVSQMVIAAAALIGAWFTRHGIGRALGIGKPALPLFARPCLEPRWNRVWPNSFHAIKCSAVPFVLFISLTPVFVEEAFFRGYMQRRLLMRWSPWLAIFTSAALFALLHLDLHTIVFAFPFGVWLGVIAWRTGSIWPCILTHAAWNALAVSWGIGEHLLGLPEYPPLVPSIAVGALVLVCFIASVWILARSKPSDPDEVILVAEEMRI